MKRAAFVLSFIAAVLLAGTPVAAQSLSELFQTAKEQVRGGSWEQALSTLGTLQTEAARPGHEDAQQKLEGPIAFYRGVCEANLGQAEEAVEAFKAFLRVEPDATLDSTLYSTKTVAAFEEARKSAGDLSLPLADAYREFRVPPDAAQRDRVDDYWADGPVRWIMTSEEKKAWSALADPNARVEFVEEFWAARSTLRGADGRTYREEFERRVAFADVHLVQDPEQRGSVTDRGMVFVLLGPPTWASRRPLRTGDDRNDHAGMSAVGSAGRQDRGEGDGRQAPWRDDLGEGPGPRLPVSRSLEPGRRNLRGARGVELPSREIAQGCLLPDARRALRDQEGLREPGDAARRADDEHARRGEETGRADRRRQNSRRETLGPAVPPTSSPR